MQISDLDFPELYQDESGVIKKKGGRIPKKLRINVNPWRFEVIKTYRNLENVILFLSDANIRYSQIERSALISIILTIVKCKENTAYQIASFLDFLSRNVGVFL